jgi:hypothetical protein
MSEPNVRAALLQAKGDIFIASNLLRMPAPHLDRCIRASEPMMAFAATIAQVKADPDYEKMSGGQFAAEINRLSSQYALDGLNVIHELATGDAFTAAEKQVKLDAAVHLRGGAAIGNGGSEMEQLLHVLNQQYQEHAPRIREIRKETTTLVIENSRTI